MFTKQQLINRLNEFRQCEDGWHFGEGYGINHQCIDTVIKMLDFLDCGEVEVFPCVDGNVMLCLYNKINNKEVEMIFSPQGNKFVIRDA